MKGNLRATKIVRSVTAPSGRYKSSMALGEYAWTNSHTVFTQPTTALNECGVQRAHLKNSMGITHHSPSGGV